MRCDDFFSLRPMFLETKNSISLQTIDEYFLLLVKHS